MPEALQLSVEIEPMHVDKQTKIGPIKQRLGQSRVKVAGKNVAYICDAPGSPLNFIVKLPTELQASIKAEVDRQRNNVSRATSSPPSDEAFNRAVNALNDLDEEDDD